MFQFLLVKLSIYLNRRVYVKYNFDNVRLHVSNTKNAKNQPSKYIKCHCDVAVIMSK